MKTKIDDLSRKLKALHKQLLEKERVLAEQHFGRKLGPYDFLTILMSDKNFAWLRPFSTLIVDIDTFVDEAEEVTPEDIKRIKDKVNLVLQEGFVAARLLDHTTQDAEFVHLHLAMNKAMAELK